MIKQIKRSLSVLQAAVMISSMFAAPVITAHATNYNSAVVSGDLHENDCLMEGVTVIPGGFASYDHYEANGY